MEDEPKLSKAEQEAIDLLKENIVDWLEEQMQESHGLSAGNTLKDIQISVFEQFTDGEEINPIRHQPLLLQALKEVLAEHE